MKKTLAVYIKLHYDNSLLFCRCAEIEEMEYLFKCFKLSDYIVKRIEKVDLNIGFRSTYYIYILKFPKRDKNFIEGLIGKCQALAQKDFMILYNNSFKIL